jgi:AhpD family alkylhydroperoxidase
MGNEVQDFYKDFARSIQGLSKESPDMVKAFKSLHDQAMKQGILGTKEKEFIALGIAVAVHCVPCIRLHTRAAVGAGASRAEILEAASVALLMGGGPAYTHIPVVTETLDAMGIA